MQNPIAAFRRSPKFWLALTVLAVLLVSAVVVKVVDPDDRGYGTNLQSDGSAAGTPDMGYFAYEKGVAMDRIVAPSAMPIEESMISPPYPPTAGETAADVDQKIIKNGYLQLVVDDVAGTSARIVDAAARRGGFVQTSSISEQGDGTYRGDVTVRMPAKDFEAAMQEIKGFATLVKHETSTGQDVTEQFTDLEAQLRNARAQEETYLAILQRANTVEDILKVQERLGMIRAQIESLQGRIQYLENVTSFSTISVSLSEEPTVRIPTKEFRPMTVVKEAFQTLVAVFQYLIAGVIWVAIVWVGALLPFVVLGWLIWKLVRRYRRQA